MEIRELMSTPAVTCRATVTLDTAARLMWENDCGVIPVTGEQGRLVGMVTDRDICMAAYLRGRPLDAIPVASAMARDVISCRAGDSIETAERLMRERQIRRLPVLDGDDRPIGVVSLNDLARHAAEAPDDVGPEDVGLTLAAIGEPSVPVGHDPTRARTQDQPPATSR